MRNPDQNNDIIGYVSPGYIKVTNELVVNVELLWDEDTETFTVVSHDKNFTDIEDAYQAGKRVSMLCHSNDDPFLNTYRLNLAHRSVVIDPDPEYTFYTYRFTILASWDWLFEIEVTFSEDEGEDWRYWGYRL